MRVLHATAAEAEQNGDEWLRALCDLDLAEIYLQLNAYGEAEQLAARARERFVALECVTKRPRRSPFAVWQSCNSSG
jgi:predicted negative regulator of RcsB-dependent stress response